MGFITNSILISTFSDVFNFISKTFIFLWRNSFVTKKELLATKKFVAVDPFISYLPFLFCALNLAYPIVTKFRFRH